jgi:hypothetical protein
VLPLTTGRPAALAQRLVSRETHPGPQKNVGATGSSFGAGSWTAVGGSHATPAIAAIRRCRQFRRSVPASKASPSRTPDVPRQSKRECGSQRVYEGDASQPALGPNRGSPGQLRAKALGANATNLSRRSLNDEALQRRRAVGRPTPSSSKEQRNQGTMGRRLRPRSARSQASRTQHRGAHQAHLPTATFG